MFLFPCPLQLFIHVKDTHGHVSVKKVLGHSFNDACGKMTPVGEGWQKATHCQAPLTFLVVQLCGFSLVHYVRASPQDRHPITAQKEAYKGI